MRVWARASEGRGVTGVCACVCVCVSLPPSEGRGRGVWRGALGLAFRFTAVSLISAAGVFKSGARKGPPPAHGLNQRQEQRHRAGEILTPHRSRALAPY